MPIREERPGRHPASQALIDLRSAIGKTQQQFAVELLQCAVPTVGRYESSNPPSGDTLLRLAEIAQAQKQPQIAERFVKLYGREVAEKIGKHRAGFVTFRSSRQYGDGGLLFAPLSTTEEHAYAEAFQLALKGLRKDQPQARDALRKFFDAMAEEMQPGEPEFYRRRMESK